MPPVAMEGTRSSDVIMCTRAVKLPVCVERFGGIEGSLILSQ